MTATLDRAHAPQPVGAEATAPAARAVGAVKVYGHGEAEVRALDGVTVEFAARPVHRDHGPVGLGQVDPHALPRRSRLASPTGSVSIGDVELSSLNDRKLTQLRRDHVGFVFQSFNLIPTLTAAENITLPIDARRA